MAAPYPTLRFRFVFDDSPVRHGTNARAAHDNGPPSVRVPVVDDDTMDDTMTGPSSRRDPTAGT